LRHLKRPIVGSRSNWHRLRELGDFNARYLHLEPSRELSPA